VGPALVIGAYDASVVTINSDAAVVEVMANRMRMASSKAMDLAQLMSLLSAFQPSVRAQAYQKSPKMIPIPQLVEASTHRSGLMDHHGLSEQEQSDLARTASHHRKLSMTDLGGWWRKKLFGNLARNAEKGGNVERPSL